MRPNYVNYLRANNFLIIYLRRIVHTPIQRCPRVFFCSPHCDTRAISYLKNTNRHILGQLLSESSKFFNRKVSINFFNCFSKILILFKTLQFWNIWEWRMGWTMLVLWTLFTYSLLRGTKNWRRTIRSELNCSLQITLVGFSPSWSVSDAEKVWKLEKNVPWNV